MSTPLGSSGQIGRRIKQAVSDYPAFTRWNSQVGQLLKQDLEELRQISVSVPRTHAAVHMGGDDSVIGPGPPVILVAGGAALTGDPTLGAQAEGHRHAAPVGTPVAIGLANAAGASGNFADAAHVHDSIIGTKGDILTVASGALAALGIGTNGHILTADSAEASGMRWGTYDTARAYHNTTQSIGHLAWTSVLMNSERFDNASLHNTSTNSDRMTVAKAGKYLIVFQNTWASSATGIRAGELRVNGTAGVGGTQIMSVGLDAITYATALTPVWLATVYELAASDYVSHSVLQDSGGGALNLNTVEVSILGPLVP